MVVKSRDIVCSFLNARINVQMISTKRQRLVQQVDSEQAQMESVTSNSTVFEISDVHLPVFRIGNSIRFDETLDDLRLMCITALPSKDGTPARFKYYYWDASDRWFQAVNIVKVKSSPFWMRLLIGNQIMIANYQLQLLDERPREWRRAYSHMRALVEYPPDQANEARASLHKCDTSFKLVTWLKTYIPPRWPFCGL